ncbi:hypothetical protein NDU88_003340 [Pleurodeles waltl]|uniref:Uncharacterized protein n=1 Tax=Pleurodeles waltl TaxID=8319 RepID=A0AAV7M6N5_PLEWA|nr:hypothetical protein NDU88_003340 [Pleurodeles waltl]
MRRLLSGVWPSTAGFGPAGPSSVPCRAPLPREPCLPVMRGSHASQLHPAAAASGQGSSAGYGLPGAPLLLGSTFRQPHTALASRHLTNRASKCLTPLPHVGLFSNVSTQGGPARAQSPYAAAAPSAGPPPSLRRFGKRGSIQVCPDDLFQRRSSRGATQGAPSPPPPYCSRSMLTTLPPFSGCSSRGLCRSAAPDSVRSVFTSGGTSRSLGHPGDPGYRITPSISLFRR